MISTSNAFHQAIRDDQPQFPLFLFSNAVVLPEDINISSGGIQFDEAAMKDDDFVPGSVCSASLSFSLFNENGEWSSFGFGEYTALLGVRTSHKSISTDANCIITLDGITITGHSSNPYLKLNGVSVSGVAHPVKSMILVNEKLFTIGESNITTLKLSGSTLAVQSYSFRTNNMQVHRRKWNIEGKSIAYGHTLTGFTTGASSDNNCMVFTTTYAEAYEMIPLGIFEAERPVFSSNKEISIESFDRMSKMDKNFSLNIAYPITIANLIYAIANDAGVPISGQYYLDSTFILDGATFYGENNYVNGDVVIPSDPDFSSYTLREVLSKAVELCGCFAKVNRYGQLVLRWFANVNYTITPHDYSECEIGYYNVAGVDSVVVRDYSYDDQVAGSGTNTVYIQNNPIAKAILGGG